MDPMERLHIRSSEFESTMKRGLSELREDEEFFDLTLACGEQQMKAHKVILSACSPFFRSLIKSIPHQHPLIYLRGVQFCHLESLLCFMYNGEVNVAYKDLSGLMAVANELQVIGLIKSVTTPSKSQATYVQEKDNIRVDSYPATQAESDLKGIPGPLAIEPKQATILESKKNSQVVTIKQESEYFISDDEMEEDFVENEFQCSVESQMVDPPEDEHSGFDFSVSPGMSLNDIKVSPPTPIESSIVASSSSLTEPPIQSESSATETEDPPNLAFVRGRNGGTQACYSGYVYTFDRKNKNGTLYWRCNARFSHTPRCTGRLYTRDKVSVIKQTPHCHEPSQRDVLRCTSVSKIILGSTTPGNLLRRVLATTPSHTKANLPPDYL